MLTNVTKKIGFVLSLIQFSLNIFACFTSLIILILLIYNLYKNKIKREDKMGIKLCVNIYIVILFYGSILISMNIQTILGDLYDMNFNTLSCILSGYLVLAMLCMLYMTFINQAFYRLIRIVYYQSQWIENFWFQIIILVIEFILCCILVCPLISWNGVIYLENDYFCYASFTNVLGVVWAASVVYIIPFLMLLSIYICITRYLRKQTNTITLIIRQRQNRDFIVIRRILIIVCLLLILGIPAMVLILLFIITGKEHPLTLRIAFSPVSISIAGLSISLIFTIPQLKTIAQNFYRTNQIAVIGNARQNPKANTTNNNNTN